MINPPEKIIGSGYLRILQRYLAKKQSANDFLNTV
jgi:hypothetical protein